MKSIDLKDIKLSNFKIPTSPNTIILLVTLACIGALLGWTGYSFFIVKPVTSTVAAPKQYYQDELKRISDALEQYKTYEIDTTDSGDTGKDDPFKSF